MDKLIDTVAEGLYSLDITFTMRETRLILHRGGGGGGT